jgi:hypothetical protein
VAGATAGREQPAAGRVRDAASEVEQIELAQPQPLTVHTEGMDAPLSKAEEDFLYKHGGLSREEVEAHAEEDARRNEELIAADMRELAEHPLDLTGVPYADEVLAALGEDMHPLVLNDFFTKPVEYFVMDGETVSVRDWLLRGCDPEPVLLYADSYLLS